MSEEETGKRFKRLSDYILEALECSLEQDDVHISEKLIQALDMAMTRCAGGQEFIERRNYPERVEKALNRFDELRQEL